MSAQALSLRTKHDRDFLVADTRLYTLPCRSVGRSIHPSCFQILSGFRITAPAQPSATGLPCIQPCFLSILLSHSLSLLLLLSLTLTLNLSLSPELNFLFLAKISPISFVVLNVPCFSISFLSNAPQPLLPVLHKEITTYNYFFPRQTDGQTYQLTVHTFTSYYMVLIVCITTQAFI